MQAKMKYLQNLDCKFVDVEIMQFHEKIQKSYSAAPKKNVELANQKSARQTNNSDFIEPSVYEGPMRYWTSRNLII